MTHTQYLATLAMDTAGQLSQAGCRVLSAHTHTGRPWLLVQMPTCINPADRRRILAQAWESTATIVEWRAK